MTVLVGVLWIAAGMALFVVGHLAADEKLPRNHVLGLRIPATLESPAAWKAGHKAAATALQAAGAVPILGGVVTLAFGSNEAVFNATTFVILGGVVVGVGVGAARAHRAAVAV